MAEYTGSSTEDATSVGADKARLNSPEAETPSEQETVRRARATKARAMDPKRTLEKLNFTIDVNGDLGFLWDIKEQYPGMRASEIRRLIRMGMAAEAAGMQMSRHAGGIDAKPGDLQAHFGAMPFNHTGAAVREPQQISEAPSLLPSPEREPVTKILQEGQSNRQAILNPETNRPTPKAAADNLIGPNVAENRAPPAASLDGNNNENKAAGAKAARTFLA